MNRPTSPSHDPTDPTSPTHPTPGPVFIVGVMNRCGTNFLADALRLHPDLVSPPFAHEDYLLEHAHLLLAYAQQTTRRWDRQAYDRQVGGPDHLARHLAGSLLAYLHQWCPPGRRLLLKTPRPLGLEHFHRLFPTARLILLLRDGRDVSESAARSFPHAGHAHWMRCWADGADRLARFIDGPARTGRDRWWTLVRYEQMLDDLPSVVGRLLAFLDAQADRFDWPALDRLPVRGSSSLRGSSRTVHWKPLARPAGFRPRGRWTAWSWWRRWQFHRIAGRQLKTMGYEPDSRWLWRTTRQAEPTNSPRPSADPQRAAAPAPEKPPCVCST